LACIFSFGLVPGLSYRKARGLPRLILAHTAFSPAITYGRS